MNSSPSSGHVCLAFDSRADLESHARDFLAEGEASLDGTMLERSVLYVLRPGTNATLRSDTGAHVMLCGGAPLDGPRHVWWNFVSSRRDRINQAKDDWRNERFPIVPDDAVERIPLPIVTPKTVSYP